MIKRISGEIVQMYFSQFGSCVYFLELNGKKIIIDTSTKKNREELISDLKNLPLNPEEVDIVILTHRHWDHVENTGLFSNAEIYTNETIDEIGIDEFKIIMTPGHTWDSFCILYKGFLFSGDTIFHNGGIGRTDLPESEPEKMQESLDKLKKLDYDVLCPGHL